MTWHEVAKAEPFAHGRTRQERFVKALEPGWRVYRVASHREKITK
jgi:hypothetical protein